MKIKKTEIYFLSNINCITFIIVPTFSQISFPVNFMVKMYF